MRDGTWKLTLILLEKQVTGTFSCFYTYFWHSNSKTPISHMLVANGIRNTITCWKTEMYSDFVPAHKEKQCFVLEPSLNSEFVLLLIAYYANNVVIPVVISFIMSGISVLAMLCFVQQWNVNVPTAVNNLMVIFLKSYIEAWWLKLEDRSYKDDCKL